MEKYGLIGEKLSHSFSPQIHALLADYEYKLYERAPDEVGAFLTGGGFDGLNVTIPYKKTVLPYCAVLSDNATKIGCVNTIIRGSDGRLYGDNTDLFGFEYMIKKSGFSPAGKKAIILGSGGASLTVKAVLSELGASEIVTISRTGSDNYSNLQKHYDADFIVNTTPVGMYPNNGVSPVELDQFTKCNAVFDLIYNPSKTKLLLDAEEKGIACANGLDMLVAQAKRACELFLSKSIDDSRIGEIVSVISRNSGNVVLIGMPGCGKSTIGRALALITGREFIDSDEQIVIKTGKSIPRIFDEDGEAVFRKIETETLEEISKKSHTVIATGGGVVTREQNRRLLRQNSMIVFIDRPIDQLSKEGRPLSDIYGIKKLHEKRYPLYCDWCDIKIPCDGVKQTAELIKDRLSL